MRNPPATEADYQRCLELEARGFNATQAAKELGIPRRTYGERLLKAKERSSAPANETRQEFTDNTGFLQSTRPDISSLDEAIKFWRIDTDVWEVARYVVNKWGNDDNPSWQVKVWLKRKVPNSFEEGLRLLIADMPRLKFKPVKLPAPKDPHMGVLALYDIHFAKLAWAAETGEGYDLKEAARRFKGAGEHLIDRAASFGCEVLEFPIGQDFFHVSDFSQHTPRSGNELDVDSRLPKIMKVGEESIIHVINYARERVKQINLRWIPGNHDATTSLYLLRVLNAWFRSANNVNVDTSPMPRQYIIYGRNLIGLTHGSDEKLDSLPTIMASECPDKFGKAICREFLIGHLHKRREWKYLAGDTFNAVSVVTVPSLSGTDAWHHLKGYVKTTKAAELHLYNKNLGKVGHFSANVDMLG